MQNWKIQVFGHLSGMWRFRWWGLAAAWAVCLTGWLVIQALPNKYESAAKVYIDTDTLMRPLMAGMTVSPDANQEVDVMMRTLITRPSVEQVVKLSDPAAAKASSAALAQEVTDVQNNISLKPQDTKNLFSISYTGDDPVFAQSVTQSLVTLLVNSNLGNQRRNVDGVQTFLDQQIAKYEAQLRDMEKKRADFKTANMEYAAAAEGGDASSMVDRAHAQTIDAQNQLGIEIARRDSLAAQLSHVPATIRVDAAPPVVINGNSESSAPASLAQAETALTNLESRFTDSHPDVIAAKNLVDRLKAQESGGAGGTSPTKAYQGISNPVYVNLQSKVADAETNVALQRRRVEQAVADEQKAHADMAQSETVAREYSDLDRDYDVIHKNYLDLVARREAANLSRAVGEQESDAVFRVIDPPRQPQFPVSPNRLMLNTAVLLLGLFFGAGVALLLHVNQDSFSVGDQLSEAFALPVLGTVSRVTAVSQQLELRRAISVTAGALAMLVACYAILILISQFSYLRAIGGF